MRIIRWLAVSITLVAVQVHEVSADVRTRVPFSLDIVDGRPPGYVCVVSPVSLCLATKTPEENACGGEISTERLDEALPVLQQVDATLVRITTLRNVDPEKIGELSWPTADQSGDSRTLDTRRAFLELAGGIADSCATAHRACRPQLQLPIKEHFIRCGVNDSSARGAGVVFIRLTGNAAAVREVRLSGTAGVVIFQDKTKLNPKDLIAQVDGGDFTSPGTSHNGHDDGFQVRLQPRCTESLIQVPPRAAKVKISKDALTILSPEPPNKSTCTPDSPIDSSFIAMLPHVKRGKKKVVLITDGGTELEASWASESPPAVLELAYRKVALSWTKRCEMTPTPTDPDDAKESKMLSSMRFAKLDKDRQLVANTSCPEIDLIATGKSCILQIPKKGGAHDSCDYVCDAPSEMTAFKLPSPLRLRRHLNRDDVATQVAEWSDTLNYAGEALVSYAPAAKRSLLVVLDNPRDWDSKRGDKIFGIEVEVANRVQRIALTGKGRGETDAKDNWFLISAPGLDCGDSVRMHVDGSRQYSQFTLPTTAGILRLERPYEYRRDKRFPIKLGFALNLPMRMRTYSDENLLRPEPMFVGGVGLEDYWDKYARGAWELAIDYHLGRMGYRAVELDAQHHGRPGRLQYVWYQRIAAKVGFTWWRWQNVHIGAGLGGGWGQTAWLKNSEMTDGHNPYFAMESWLRYTPTAGRVWIELAPELRLFEQRLYYETDFTGQPVRNSLRSVDISIELRVRFGGG